MGELFGTDGVRGIANRELTCPLAYRLGRAGALFLTGRGKRGSIIIGRDTRISGQMLEGALIAGITSAGCDVLRAGVISTPGVAHLTRSLEADAGVMISASHNPVEYNGIKFFDNQGYKLTDSEEEEIEKMLNEGVEGEYPTGSRVGRAENLEDGLSLYTRFVRETVDVELEGLKIIVDCAHGASFRAAPKVFSELGAEVIPMNVSPDGTNINVNGGSTAPGPLREKVLLEGADAGLAHDGDADRVIAVDERGILRDGDYILAICGLDMIRRGKLADNTVVATRYSNLGLKEALHREGGQLVTTKNGDRYVLEMMRKKGYNFGGEKSGHIIFYDHTTTGDGLITALKLLAVVKRKGLPLSELAEEMREYPQLMVSVEVERKEEWKQDAVIMGVIAEIERELGDNGRVFVRASGTEPVIRLMLEGEDRSRLEEMMEHLKSIVGERLN